MNPQNTQGQNNRGLRIISPVGRDAFVPSEATRWELFPPAVNALTLRPASRSSPAVIQGSGKCLPLWSLEVVALCHPAQDSWAQSKTYRIDSQEHLERLELEAVEKADTHKGQSHSHV